MKTNLIRKKLKDITINEFRGQFEICIPMTATEIERLGKLSNDDMEMLTIEGSRDANT